MLKKTFTFCLFIFISSQLTAQSIYQPYSYQFYQKLNSTVYSTKYRIHTAVKPYLVDDSLLVHAYDSLINLQVDTARKGWILKKLFDQHLFELKGNNYTFYADVLPDFQIGHDQSARTPTWLNTRGFQFGVTIGKNFSLYTSGYENQALFPEYVNNYISSSGIIPGQANKGRGRKISDWAYTSAIVSYTPSKYLNIAIAYDKNFIGDGYRSMLLSDVSANYTSLKLTGTLGNVKYMSMWSYMIDPLAPKLAPDRGTGDRHKWGAFQYLDWNINKRASIGLFQSILWPQSGQGGRRGFDMNYMNPIIFLRSIELANTTSPDKKHFGFNGKYKLLNNLSIYGQFLLSEFTAKEFFSNKGYWANKWGAQLGFRGFDAFGIKRLNYLAEYNLARPYTYAHFEEITSYSNYGQALAHPFGANFRELASIWNYSAGRFDFSGQGNYGRYGLDADGENYGKNIFAPYGTRQADYGNNIGQGISTSLYYLDGRISYLMNPKYNLRIELGGIYRNEKNAQMNHKTSLVILGLRSSFRNLYYDF
ncbi:MAG TPA: gliding motility protein RemB [Daejeonella sp.]|nr:gliding motility protein RemB [Daejeonella sp.]